MRSIKRSVQALLAGMVVVGTVLTPSAASAATLRYSDPAYDIGGGADILTVRINNARRVNVTVQHRNLRRAATPAVALYVDTRAARPGPEFVLNVNINEYYLWRVHDWQAVGDVPLACPHRASFNYDTERTHMSLSRACLGHPGRVRVSVWAASGTSRRDWAPGYHQFSQWVRRG